MYQPSDENLVVIYWDWTLGEKYTGDYMRKECFTIHYNIKFQCIVP